MEAIELLGLTAGLFTSISTTPQLIKIWREKQADHVSVVALLVTVAAGILWVIYGSLKPDFPVLITNSVAVLINGSTTALRIKYSGMKEKKE